MGGGILMNKKPKINQLIRHLIQLISAFLYPALFVICFSQLKQVYLLFYQRNFNFTPEIPYLVELLVVLSITAIFGRFFCGFFCTFGSLLEMWRVSVNKVIKINYKMNEKLDRALKLVKYILLIFIVVFLWTLKMNGFNSFSPWDAIAELRDFPDIIFLYNVGFVILIFSFFGEMFVERCFCRYLCPLGAVLNLTSVFSIFKIKRSDTTCGNCESCSESCPMGIDVKNAIKINNECIRCLKCIEVCPSKKNIAFISREKLNIKNTTSIIFTIVVIVSLFSGITVSKNDNNTIYQALENARLSGKYLKNTYKSGTYIGIGAGYRPDLEVKVVIEQNRITDIQIIKDSETKRFSEEAFKLLPQKIIEKQSTNVDSISGATRTCDGIIASIEDALSQAEKN